MYAAGQVRHLSRTTSLEGSLARLDAAYYALRERGYLCEAARDGRGPQAAEAPVVSKGALSEALDAIDCHHEPEELDELWALLDADSDGVLSHHELTIAGARRADSKAVT